MFLVIRINDHAIAPFPGATARLLMLLLKYFLECTLTNVASSFLISFLGNGFINVTNFSLLSWNLYQQKSLDSLLHWLSLTHVTPFIPRHPWNFQAIDVTLNTSSHLSWASNSNTKDRLKFWWNSAYLDIGPLTYPVFLVYVYYYFI